MKYDSISQSLLQEIKKKDLWKAYEIERLIKKLEKNYNERSDAKKLRI